MTERKELCWRQVTFPASFGLNCLRLRTDQSLQAWDDVFRRAGGGDLARKRVRITSAVQLLVIPQPPRGFPLQPLLTPHMSRRHSPAVRGKLSAGDRAVTSDASALTTNQSCMELRKWLKQSVTRL